MVPKIIPCAMLALASLAACSSGDDALKTSPTKQTREFSEEDKMAARSLSIGNNQAMAKAGSPYAETLLCRRGMEVLAQRFQETGGLSEQQRQGIEQAQAYFDQQLRRLGSREGKSADNVGDDLEQAVRDNSDATENARIAIACLQKLQGG